MMMRFHEIVEANHRILNPFSDEKLMLLGQICRPTPLTTHLDLCCGKGEMLSRWAQRFGSIGIGVDTNELFLESARSRAQELGVERKVSFVNGQAEQFVKMLSRYDIVSCLGATWIGDGLIGTLGLMKSALKPGGLLLVGDCYWISTPPQAARSAMGFDPDVFASLSGTRERIEAAGCHLVEMVLADEDSWDRYVAAQWFAFHDWLRDNPDDPDATELLAVHRVSQRTYLEYQRDYLGWGVFVVQPDI